MMNSKKVPSENMGSFIGSTTVEATESNESMVESSSKNIVGKDQGKQERTKARGQWSSNTPRGTL